MDKYGDKAFDLLKSWDADGVKIDFIDRDDQQASQFYERMAKLAADRQMVVDFHGCAKPAGLQRTYPNVVNFEAVRGCEFNKFSDGIPPSHNIDLLFTRMLQGPMDYTPGALRNMQKKDFRKSYSFPNAMGTRAHTVSMFVLFYGPVQMLCDSASEYKKYPDVLNFLANAPTTWDDTKALEGKIGEYAVIARRKGDSWYIGGMTDWKSREVEIDLSKILPEGKDFKAEIIRDVENSNRKATDYVREVQEITSATTLKIKMQKGGGFAVKITPKMIPVVDDIIKFFAD
jgi:alpha-glucosidase